MKILRKTAISLICLMAVLCLAGGAAYAYSPSTGDKVLDSRLDAIDTYAAAHPDAFVTNLSVTYKVDEQTIRDSLAQGMKPADVYMSLRLGSITGTPPAELQKGFLSNPGKGWGVIAKSLGVKPGSAGFKSLKSGAVKAAGKEGKSSESGKDKSGKGNAGGNGKGGGNGGGNGGGGGGGKGK